MACDNCMAAMCRPARPGDAVACLPAAGAGPIRAALSCRPTRAAPRNSDPCPPANSTKLWSLPERSSATRRRSGCSRDLTALEQRVVDASLGAPRRIRSAGCSAAAITTRPRKGLYIFGDVGRGKTMLMDLFFEASPVVRKRRVHFHEFMADVHERVRVLRQKLKYGEIADDDPIRLAAAEIAEESWLLCFDEFHVTDIADAMILGRLFARLFELGVVVVATSNVAPGELYQGGLNRALFLPFIAMIEQHMEVLRAHGAHRLPAGKARRPARSGTCRPTTTRRRRSTRPGAGWSAARAACRRSLSVKGRKLRVPRAAMGVARFFFHDLCEQPLAAVDYLRIAHEFHTADPRPHSGHGLRPAQRRQALHHPDRHALRPRRQARGLGGGRAGRALSGERRLRGGRIQAHGVAADRDALAEPTSRCRTAGAIRPRAGRARGSWRREGRLVAASALTAA